MIFSMFFFFGWDPYNNKVLTYMWDINRQIHFNFQAAKGAKCEISTYLEKYNKLLFHTLWFGVNSEVFSTKWK